MNTAIDRAPPGGPAGGSGYAANQTFFVRLAWGCAAVIVIGFLQNAALGRVDIPRMPIWVHLHGVLMLAWLALFVTQNTLAAQGNLVLHRRLGWIGAGLVCVVVAVAEMTSLLSLTHHRYPPFFTPPYFLALGIGEAGSFAALVAAGIVWRRDTETHRRLIMGGTLVLLEPGFGRLLPLPLIGGEAAQCVLLAVQLIIVALIAREDRRSLGRILPATWVVGATLIATHALVSLAARLETTMVIANRLMAHQSIWS